MNVYAIACTWENSLMRLDGVYFSRAEAIARAKHAATYATVDDSAQRIFETDPKGPLPYYVKGDNEICFEVREVELHGTPIQALAESAE